MATSCGHLRSKDPTTQDRPTTAMCCHAHTTWWCQSLNTCLDISWYRLIDSSAPNFQLHLTAIRGFQWFQGFRWQFQGFHWQFYHDSQIFPWPKAQGAQGLQKASKAHPHRGQQDQWDRPGTSTPSTPIAGWLKSWNIPLKLGWFVTGINKWKAHFMWKSNPRNFGLQLYPMPGSSRFSKLAVDTTMFAAWKKCGRQMFLQCHG